VSAFDLDDTLSNAEKLAISEGQKIQKVMKIKIAPIVHPYHTVKRQNVFHEVLDGGRPPPRAMPAAVIKSGRKCLRHVAKFKRVCL
jgi:hypothetical protein